MVKAILIWRSVNLICYRGGGNGLPHKREILTRAALLKEQTKHLFLEPANRATNIRENTFEGERERERERERWHVPEEQREMEGKNLKQAPHSAQNLMRGSIPRTVRSWPAPKSRVRCLTDWATRALQEKTFLKTFSTWYFKKPHYYINYYERNKNSIKFSCIYVIAGRIGTETIPEFL